MKKLKLGSLYFRFWGSSTAHPGISWKWSFRPGQNWIDLGPFSIDWD